MKQTAVEFIEKAYNEAYLNMWTHNVPIHKDFIPNLFKQAKEMEKQYLFNTLVDFVGFPHDHEEPRGVTIARFLEQLKNK
jgi:hypothetical protein